MPGLSKSFRYKFLALILFATAWSVYHEKHTGGFARTINIDGIGYNAYLPALFLHDGDLKWQFYANTLEKLPVFKERLQDFRKPVQNGRYVNKYPLGLAISQAPLWFVAWGLQGFSPQLSGYEMPFQIAVFLNNLLWLFLGFWLFSRFLRQRGASENSMLLTLGLLLFATNLFHFITFDNSLTHPVTLGFSMIAFYVLQRFMTTSNSKHLIAFLLIFSVMFWIRPVNIFMAPFYAIYFFFGEQRRALPTARQIFLIVGGALFALFIYLGSIKLQTGNWLVYTYQNEKFVFSEFHLVDILFGYRCGLFLYTPIMLMAIVFWFFNPNKKLVLGYAAAMILAMWVISTWNEYCYGCRLGNRPMVDYFAFFVVPVFGSNLEWKKYFKFLVVLFLVFCLYYNQILHYQYRHYILDWCNVQKEQFWKVFLHTHRPSNDQ